MSYEIVIRDIENNDNYIPENNSNYSLIIMALIIAIVIVLVASPKKQSVTHLNITKQNNDVNELLNWRLPKQTVSSNDLLNWQLPTITQSSVKHSRTKVPPQDLIIYARQLGQRYNIVPSVILGACYHERMLLNWYDDFACGFGAISSNRKDWKRKYAGWQRQMRLFAKRANRCNMFRTLPTAYQAQMFAKNCYKTEDYSHYKRVAGYTRNFNKYF